VPRLLRPAVQLRLAQQLLRQLLQAAPHEELLQTEHKTCP
jgi:hypothetical protein